MIIVSCPYCYKANYVVVAHARKHEQRLECGSCKRTFLMKITPRRGKSGKVDAVCERIGELGTADPS
jgi:transposase-like protein